MSAAVPHDEEGTSGQVDLRPSGYHRKSAAAVGIQIGIAVGYPHSSYAVRSDEDMPDESEDEDEDKDFDMSKIPGVVRHTTDRFNIT